GFSILETHAHEVGGAPVPVPSLHGRDANEHVFEPSPDQVRLLTQAQLFVVNGLGLEGWVTRLIQSPQSRGTLVFASEGIEPIAATEGSADPHAWQDPRNGIVYARNIMR